MNCENCEEREIKYFGFGSNKKFDGYICKLTGLRTGATDCPLENNGKVEKKNIDPDDKFVRVD